MGTEKIPQWDKTLPSVPLGAHKVSSDLFTGKRIPTQPPPLLLSSTPFHFTCKAENLLSSLTLEVLSQSTLN